MILQKFALYPYSEETTQLYMKTTDDVVTDKEKVELKTLAKVNLETYFNLFSCLKWKKYVGVESVYLRLKLNGIVKVKIDHLQVKDGDVERHGVLDEEIQSDASGYVTSNEFTLPEKGMLGVMIEAVSESVLYEVDFSTDQTGMEENDICIGIGICTFKREKYVERNMNLLKEGILNNPAAEAYDHIKICISDNAGTLEPEKIENPEIHVVKNKNLGGVGGFTRTMLEYLNGEEKISHVLLKRMNRRYDAAEYREKCELLRKYFENPALTTDVIVGFPQESEEEFEASRDFVDSINFYETHIFKYSKRQGTKAAKMDGQIPEHEKTRRSNIMLELNRKKMQRYEEGWLGKKVEVLFEEMTERDGKNYVTGHTKEYLRIGVPCEPEQADRWINQLKEIELTSLSQIMH